MKQQQRRLHLLASAALAGIVVCGVVFAAACSSANADARATIAKAPPRPAHPSPLGTNLAPLVDWGTERPFVDLMKQARGWISSDGTRWDDGRTIAVDASGWPTQLAAGQIARALVAWDVPTPKDNYVVTWTGTGTIDTAPQAATSMAEHRATFTCDGGNIAITITATDPKDPIKNIRVVATQFDVMTPVPTFHPAFLQALSPFSVLRFMDWMHTNDGAIAGFSTRALPSDASYAGKGVPVEVMIDLCNALGVDGWFTVPHSWSDDDVRGFAQLLHERLRPQLHAWIEHSNEVWNSMFVQAHYADSRGGALSKDAFLGRLRFHSQRTVQLMNIFDAVFAADRARVVRVMGSMASNPWVSEQELEYQQAAAHVDVLAIAPYFGGSLGDADQWQRVRALSTTEMNAELTASLAQAREWMVAQKKVAERFGVALVAYEGGQHLVGVGVAANDDQLTHVLTRANSDPHMKDAYLSYLAMWRAAGGTLFVHYTSVMRPTKFGAWGAKEHIEQPRTAAPKWDALATFVETTPRWW